MRKLMTPVFCLALVLAFQGTAWSQTKNEKESAWLKGAREAAPQAVARYGHIIAAAARRHQVPKEVLGGVMLVESSGDAKAPGGLMQAGESAKRATGIRCDTRKPNCSIEVSAAYLKKLRRDYNLDWPRAILAYNKGPAVAQQTQKPYRHQYLKRVVLALAVYNDALINRN